MASKQSTVDFILDQIRAVGDVSSELPEPLPKKARPKKAK